MDPPNSTTNHPFARPLSQPNGHDTLRAAIPPPPYTLQAPVQRQPSLGNDPFLPRRQEQAGPGQDMDKAFRHGPFGVAKYATSLPRDALGVATENYNRAQENDGGWRFGDGRIDRFRPHTSGGEFRGFIICIMQSLVFHRHAISCVSYRAIFLQLDCCCLVSAVRLHGTSDASPH